MDLWLSRDLGREREAGVEPGARALGGETGTRTREARMATLNVLTASQGSLVEKRSKRRYESHVDGTSMIWISWARGFPCHGQSLASRSGLVAVELSIYLPVRCEKLKRSSYVCVRGRQLVCFTRPSLVCVHEWAPGGTTTKHAATTCRGSGSGPSNTVRRPLLSDAYTRSSISSDLDLGRMHPDGPLKLHMYLVPPPYGDATVRPSLFCK